MFHKTTTKAVVIFLCVVMCLSAFPMAAFASIPNWETGNVVYDKATFGTNDYYTVISKKDYVLVPGAATETELVINNATGDRRQVMHIIEVDPSNPDVSLVPGYYGIDKDITDVANQQAAKLTDMAKYYEEQLGYNIVGGMNTDLYYAANAPRVLVYNGKDMRDYGATSSVLCVYKAADGTISADVKAYSAATMDDELANGHATKGQLLHAVGVSFGMTVVNGELVNKTEERTSAPAARSMVGVKPDGTLVICMNDGRGANNSVGFCNYELGESMLALGCQWAANCDGGGSSTFISKRVGEDSFTMRSVPCDGAERPTIHGIFVASNVGPTGELDYAEIEADYDYFAPGSSYKFDAKGIDTNGYQMDLPADITWAISDSSFGTIGTDGTFVSNGTVGDVDVKMLSGDKEIGTKTIHVANPETLTLSATSTVVPYSTADKVRQINLPIVAKIGESNVYYDANVFEITMSVEAAGTLNGFVFTATDDESIAGTVISAKYIPTGAVLTYTVEFGKGSEIVYDFENGDTSNFMSFDEAKQWTIDNGVTNSLIGSSPIGGQYSPEVDGSTFLATTENGGQVKNGQYALGWKVDNTNSEFAQWTYNILYNVGGPLVLRDVDNGKKATTFGMWAYIPEGATGIAMQLQAYLGASAENAAGGNIHFYFASAATGAQKTLNSATEEDIPESRWVYMTASLTSYKYVSLVDPYANKWGREPSFIRTYVKPVSPAVHTFYFDDFTLDYSSAVDDRIAPVISDFTYDPYVDTSLELKEGMTITQMSEYGVRGFSAIVSDASPLDESSRKITIDGVPVHTSYTNGRIYCTEHFLLPGTHTIAFEIADEMGNVGRATRTFTIVDSDPFISLDGHNNSGKLAEFDSVYYIDINVKDLSKIGDKLITTLKLNNANTWEIQGAVVADGFKAEFNYNEISDLLDVIVTKTSSVATAAGTLVSIPVRVWSWDGINHVTGEAITPQQQFGSANCPIVTIDCEIVYGNMEGAGYNEASMGVFGGSFSVETNLNDNINPWHYHDATLTVSNKEATCTTDGYIGRTYCETCASVVDWGNIVKATGHNYVLTDGKFVCTADGCGEVYEMTTGLFEINGKYYYSIAGNLMSGWQQIGDDYYYFDSTTFTSVETLNNGYVTFKFEEDGKLVSGEWYKTSAGNRYFYGPSYYIARQVDLAVEIDGKTYYFNKYGYCMTGKSFVRLSNSTHFQWYDFGTDGALIGEWDYTGLAYLYGHTYCVVDGVSGYGMFYMDGAYYYCASGNYYAAVTNIERDCPVTNGLMPVGTYRFGKDGKMLDKAVCNVDGILTYYELGKVSSGNGSVEINGKTWTVDENGKVLFTGTCTDANGNTLYYENGIHTKEIKNGVYGEFLYINDVLQTRYKLVEYNGDYYFVGDGNKITRNATLYLAEQYVKDMTYPDGTPILPDLYKFDAEGKMVILNGVYGDYLYINGVVQKRYQLASFGGNYYFINDGNKVAKNCTLYLGENFVAGKTYPDGTAIVAGLYQFDAEGKMVILNGVVNDYLYINGIAQKRYQLAYFDGNYYFINDGDKVAKNCTLYLGENFVAGKTYPDGTAIVAGLYQFDAEGKMVIINGVVNDYLYINGIAQKRYQLAYFDGNYYFINDGDKIAKNCTLYLSDMFVSGKVDAEGNALKAGIYEFDSEGKMIID